jgi:hypothetical protein
VRTRLGVLDVAADERNGRWRQALAFLVAGVVVAAAVGLFWIVTEGGRTSSTADDATTAIEVPAPWDGARLDRNRLRLYFTARDRSRRTTPARERMKRLPSRPTT